MSIRKIELFKKIKKMKVPKKGLIIFFAIAFICMIIYTIIEDRHEKRCYNQFYSTDIK